jgi:hypothetical protein
LRRYLVIGDDVFLVFSFTFSFPVACERVGVEAALAQCTNYRIAISVRHQHTLSACCINGAHESGPVDVIRENEAAVD